ncbi:MAG: hypothetical protein AAF490_04285, partial [Chloroflexota bacterium]
SLTNEDGKGLKITADGLMETTVRHITDQELTDKFHTNELERQDEIMVNIDHLNAAIGGASCGPRTLEEYWIRPDTFKFSFKLEPIS